MKIVVVGLGQFGSSVARELVKEGHEVLAIERDRDIAEKYINEKKLTYIACANAGDKQALEALNIDESYEKALVAIGVDISSAILATFYLKELGVKHVTVKAGSSEHKRVYEKIGADAVILPEKEMGRILARKIANPNIQEVSLSPDYTSLTFTVNESLVGMSVKEIDMRRKYKANIIAIEKTSADNGQTNLIDPEYIVQAEDKLTVIIARENIDALENEIKTGNN
ncbi:potassium channel family protein [Candidatus Riflebacteria bacterium]